MAAGGVAERTAERRVGARSRDGVVVGIDGSGGSARAAAWAADEAAARGVPLTVVGVAEGGSFGPDRDLQARMRATVDECVAQLAADHPGLEVAGESRVGIAAAELIDASGQADLLVVGSRGLGGFAGLLLGSVGQHVVAHGASSVAIVRGSGAAGNGEVRPVVVGVDDSPGSDRALEVAVAEAARRHVPLEIVGSAIFPAASGYVVAAGVAVDDAARVAVDRAVARANELDATVVTRGRVIDDPPPVSLAAASRRADLLVVGSRGLGAFRGLLLGSVSHALATHAACTLLVVRGAGTAHTDNADGESAGDSTDATDGTDGDG